MLGEDGQEAGPRVMIWSLMLGAASETVGREEELASIARFLDATALSGVLVLEGEAGIGKTTLWHEGVRSARERAWQVLISRPARSEVRFAFAGLTDLLGPAVQPVLPELPAPQRRALEAALLLREESAPPDPRTIAVAFLSALRVLARDRPVLLAVDDVQWLDEPSARVLAFALRRLEGERIAALFTQRVGGEGEALHTELDRALREESVESLRIGPLSLGALHVLLRDRLALTLPRPAFQQMHTASGGNPFIALEIARAVQRRGGRLDPREPLPVPTAVDELLGERLGTLPVETLEALLVVAAQPGPTLSALSAVVGEDLDARVQPALTAQVLEFEGTRLRFSHPLLASAVYSRAGHVRRRAVHRRLAELAATVEERARHLALSTDAPDDTVASELDGAAAAAAARGAADAAAQLSELALDFTSLTQVEDVRRRRLSAAGHLQIAGEVARSRKILEQLLETLPAGRMRSQAMQVLYFLMDDWALSGRMAEQALAEAPDDPAIAARSHSYLSSAWLHLGDIPRARAHAHHAVQLAERLPEGGLALAQALAYVILLDTVAGVPVEEEVVARALALEHANPGTALSQPPSLSSGLRAMYADRLKEAHTLFAAVERRAVEEGYELLLGVVRLQQARLAIRAGEWDVAARYAEEGRQITERIALGKHEAQLLYVTASVAAHRGRVEEARAAAERGHALASRSGSELVDILCLAVLGFLELSRGDAAAADRYLRPLPGRVASAGVRAPNFCPALPDAIEALVLIGELDLARAFAARLDEQARKVDSLWARALAARCCGLIAAAAGAFDEALAHFRRSLDEELPEPFERARTLLALGSTQRRAKQRRQARATLEEALSVFERLGAPLWATKARAELARIGGRVAHAELTATERQVAELVARGLPNKEVAAALVVSERAVEANLTRIYEKLGIRSRTQLARRVASEDLNRPAT